MVSSRPPILQFATLSDLASALGWLPSPAAMRLWGGPQLRWGASAAEVWETIQAAEHRVYALVDDGALQGLAQIVERDGRAHLARVIVDPHLRGQGVGERLLRAVLAQALALSVAAVTLNVYRENRVAIRLYRKLGFDFCDADANGDSLPMIWKGGLIETAGR
ncbi:GNAT family N-acetyltransferase [Paludibacterium yongneupense]|uniref:GNAT family N-acetyltransferase n=1 Tax=Paludibacterium yongneupense TaxID=400061 RepID=UPI00041DE646|nr:GNAT family N-acetyltransferase [Paludibacterium yongneupense]